MLITETRAVTRDPRSGTVLGDEFVQVVYDDRDPLVVTFVCGRIRWTVARDLLAEGTRSRVPLADAELVMAGLRAPGQPGTAGRGDLLVVSTEGMTLLRLDGPNGVVLQVRRRVLRGFLRDTFRLVPPGSERVNVERWIEELLPTSTR